jgi:hypothetical protein
MASKVTKPKAPTKRPRYDPLEIVDHNKGDKIAPLPKGDVEMAQAQTDELDDPMWIEAYQDIEAEQGQGEEGPMEDLFEGDVPMLADSDGEISEEE